MKDGLYESVIDSSLKEELNSKELTDKKKTVPIDEWNIPSYNILSSYIQNILKDSLSSVHKKDSINNEIEICNKLIEELAAITNNNSLLEKRIINEKDNLLVSIFQDKTMDSFRPKTPMSVSSIFTGKSSNIPLYEELKREIRTSDEVLFLVSFIKMSGLMQIIQSLEDFTNKGGKLRILTTTYMGVTEKCAIDRLMKLKNTEIHISYDTNSTRLHAKAYIFKRETGLNTAFIGSSNLSKAAMNDGMEWNVKLTSKDVPEVINNIFKLYEQYWNSDDFSNYDPLKDSTKLDKSLNIRTNTEKNQIITLFDLRPYPFQNQILEQLQAEREIHNHYRNLVISATGTGKTMIAAFDYRRYSNGRLPNMLFIAHREDILNKSMNTFRAVLREPNFGNVSSGSHGFDAYKHQFITVQTLNSVKVEKLGKPDFFEYIVIDEVHHGTASTYRPIFEYFKPKILLGLTATPERMDGEDITKDFDNRIACEIRLPEAIDRELLVPFHYYGLTDNADYTSVKYENGKLNEKDLNTVLCSNKERAQRIVDCVRNYKPDINSIKGLGFCVSVEHAKFMCDFFNKSGYKARYIVGNNSFECGDANKQLTSGEIHFIFSVDVYNEGIDIPSVNLILFLRPTKSMTVFIQQLGRGLRLSEGKTELTVLDFVGQADNRYKLYGRKLEYLSTLSSEPLKNKIKNGFSGLPVGCSIELEEKTREYILGNIERAIGTKAIINRLNEFYHINKRIPELEEFITWLDINLTDLYKNDLTFYGMCSRILGKNVDVDLESNIAKGLRRLSLIDSVSWIHNLEKLLRSNQTISDDNPYALMLYYTITLNEGKSPRTFTSLDSYIKFLRESDYYEEILTILKLKLSTIDFIEVDSGLNIPLKVYCSYTQNQILAGMGLSTFHKKHELREGVYHIKQSDLDLFFITLNKNENEYSINTMYNDYAINDKLFHWESQNKTTDNGKDGSRYRDQTRKLRTLLFVREFKKLNGQTSPYEFIGRGNFKSSEGSKPMKVIWEMENTIPPSIIEFTSRV